MRNIPRILSFGAFAIAVSGQVASAADYQYWRDSAVANAWNAGGANNWNTDPPWSGIPPTGGPTGNDNLDLAAASGATISFNEDRPYAINNISASTAGQGIHSGINNVWIDFSIGGNVDVASGASLRFYNGGNLRNLTITVAGDVDVASGGTFYLGDNNQSSSTTNAAKIRAFSVAGTTTVSGAIRGYMGNTTASTIELGDLVLNTGGTLTVASTGATTATSDTTSRSIGITSLSGAGSFYASDSTASGLREATLLIATGAATDVSFSGLLADSEGSGVNNHLHVSVSGIGRQALTGLNTYTGVTTIEGGTLAAGVLADGGSASSIGASANAASNLVIDGGALEYTGGAASTNRLFTVSENGATLDASGTGAITFGNTGDVVYSGSGARTLGFSGGSTANNTFAGRILDGTGGATSLAKSGAGTWVLSGTHGYTGATSITAGKLVVDGSIAASSGVTLGAGATLGGHGTVSAIGGAGTVGPGNSPGILTATQVDGSGGLDFAFEFTTQASDGFSLPDFSEPGASGNDALRLTSATPFLLELTAANTVTVDFSDVTLLEGDVYLGGFYADSGDFLEQIGNATFQFVGLDGKYVSVSTVQQSADFGGGLVNGYITQFTVVPEPGTFALFGISVIGLAAALRRKGARRAA